MKENNSVQYQIKRLHEEFETLDGLIKFAENMGVKQHQEATKPLLMEGVSSIV